MNKQSELIAKIAKKARRIAHVDAATVALDISACIEGGCQLRLEDMLEASDFDLMHDVLGINKHLDRDTYQLKDCFLPRFAR